MVMKKVMQGALAMVVSLSMISPVPGLAKNGKGTAKAAIVVGTAAVVLGAAALADDDGRRRPDSQGPWRPSHREKREYDRGYRDGKRGFRPHNYNDTRAYREGYRDGRRDRRDRNYR